MADAIPWATSAALAGGAAACWACGVLSATLYGDASTSRVEEPEGVGGDAAAAADAAAGGEDAAAAAEPPAVLPCLRARRSVFPRDFAPDGSVSRAVVQSLLEAAAWAPFHGPVPPWRFVVLGRDSMREMQRLTLDFYDRNWASTGWSCGKRGSEAAYQKWRTMTEGEIEGRWGGVSFFLAIVQRRQAGSKRMPEWEEAAATACAVQVRARMTPCCRLFPDRC